MDKTDKYGFFVTDIDCATQEIYNIIGDVMINNIENLKLIDIINGMSVKRRVFESRFCHALVFKISGESLYRFDTETLTLKCAEVLFIPKGSSYVVNRISDRSDYVLVNFDADIPDALPAVYSLEGYPNKSYIYEHLSKQWLLGGESEKYKCYSMFYNLLSFLLSKDKPHYSYTKKFKQLESALNYLHTNIFDCDLKVDNLHLLCGMSDTYFRKIFKANYGISPMEYIINKRMSRAQSIITSGEYNSINEVALSVGYSDALYFSRVFSKKFGICPSKFIEK